MLSCLPLSKIPERSPYNYRSPRNLSSLKPFSGKDDMMGSLPLSKKREAERHVYFCVNEVHMSWHVRCRAGVAHLSSLFQNLGLRHGYVDRQYSKIKSRSKRCLSNYLEIICPGFFYLSKRISLCTVFRRPKALTRVSFCSALIFAPLKASSRLRMCWAICQFLKSLLGRSILVISKSNSTT